jgi:membrane protein YqaA with SNARE-associated domain
MTGPDPPEGGLASKRAAAGLLGSLAAIVAVCAVAGWLAGPWVEAASRGFVDRFGATGVLAGVIAAEASPVPLAGEPFLLGAKVAGMSLGRVLALAIAGNLVAAFLAYGLGAALDRLGLTSWLLGGRRVAAEEAVGRHGAWALVIASVTPLPFGTLAWVAGALRMPLVPFTLASLVRIPKAVVYVLVWVFGWSFGR